MAPTHRTSHCRGCGARHDHHLLFEPDAFHALAKHRHIFCGACGGLALFVPANMATRPAAA